jgi:O-antigen/teichoic acid export membrane protein
MGVTIGLAEYGIAYRGLEAALGLVGAIGVVILPLLAHARGSDRTELAARIEEMLTGVAILLGTLVFLLAPVAASLLGGDRYPDAAWYLRLLAPAVVITVINLGYAHVAIVQNRHRALLAIAGASVVANVALNLMLIPTLGVTGAVVSTLTTELVGALLVARVASHSLPGSVRLARPAAGFAGFLVACFGGLGAWNAWGPAAGTAAALAGLTVACAPISRGIVQLLRSRTQGAEREPTSDDGSNPGPAAERMVPALRSADHVE